jgi:hypothetical protein
VVLCGISHPFERLSRTQGYVTHVLLTRAPLYSPPEGDFLARLACVKHAANVRSEPGSNSPVCILNLNKITQSNFNEDTCRCFRKNINYDLVNIIFSETHFTVIDVQVFVLCAFLIPSSRGRCLQNRSTVDPFLVPTHQAEMTRHSPARRPVFNYLKTLCLFRAPIHFSKNLFW